MTVKLMKNSLAQVKKSMFFLLLQFVLRIAFNVEGINSLNIEGV